MRPGHSTRVDLYAKAKARNVATHEMHKSTATTLGWMDKKGNPDVGRVQSALGRVVNVPGGLHR